jgi:anaerobic magnesium-protoporphyrin IX monomethyl ester cyclase
MGCRNSSLNLGNYWKKTAPKINQDTVENSCMKVALITPMSDLKLSDLCAPLNLCYLASYIRKTLPSVDVRIFDGLIKQDVKALLFEFKPEIIGVTATTPQAIDAYKFLDWVKANFPNSLALIGGIHASVLPEEAAEHADCVVKGEGERAIVEIIEKRMRNEAIPKIVEDVPIDNLDDIPSPAYDLIDMKKYLSEPPSFPGLITPVVTIVTSRGCPYKCPFCWNSARTFKVRYFSAQRIVEEIIYFRENFGVNTVWFADDEFLINKKRLAEFAKLLKEKHISDWLIWGCQARAKTIDHDTLELAKSVGCVAISVGFESGCARTLEFLKCGTTKIEDHERALKIAKEVGVTTGGSFIFGTPGETYEEMRETINWCENEKNLMWYGFNTIIPYPGTTVWKICQEQNLLPKDLDYRRLVPTGKPNKTYVVNHSVPFKKYEKMLIYAGISAWFFGQARQHRSVVHFFSMARTPTWWWMWLHYPSKMVKVLKQNYQ